MQRGNAIPVVDAGEVELLGVLPRGVGGVGGRARRWSAEQRTQSPGGTSPSAALSPKHSTTANPRSHHRSSSSSSLSSSLSSSSSGAQNAGSCTPPLSVLSSSSSSPTSPKLPTPSAANGVYGTLYAAKRVTPPVAEVVGVASLPAGTTCVVRALDISRHVVQSQRTVPGLTVQSIVMGVAEEVAKGLALYSGYEHLCQPVAVAAEVGRSEVWVVYPYVAGCDLVTYWRSLPEARRTEQRLASLLRRLVSVLAPLHADSRVHGGLKGVNIIVSPKGDSMTLLDHGLYMFERFLPRKLSDVAPWQLPPEVLGRSVATCATALVRLVDVWAVGLLVVEVLKGSAPLSLLGSVQSTALLNDTAQCPASVVLEGAFPLAPVARGGGGGGGGLSTEVSDFVTQCLTRKTANRPASCQVLLNDAFIKQGSDLLEGGWSAAIPIARGQKAGVVSPGAAGSSPVSVHSAPRSIPTSQPSRKTVADIPALLLSGIGKNRHSSIEPREHAHSPRFVLSARGADSARSTRDMSPRDGLGGARRGSTPSTAFPGSGGSMLETVLLPAMDAVLSDVPAATAERLFTLVSDVQSLSSSIESQWADATTLFVKEMISAIESYVFFVGVLYPF